VQNAIYASPFADAFHYSPVALGDVKYRFIARGNKVIERAGNAELR